MDILKETAIAPTKAEMGIDGYYVTKTKIQFAIHILQGMKEVGYTIDETINNLKDKDFLVEESLAVHQAEEKAGYEAVAKLFGDDTEEKPVIGGFGARTEEPEVEKKSNVIPFADWERDCES